MNPLAPSRAIINLKAYAHNLSVIQEMVPPDCRIMGIVKADAYGHGAVPVAMMAVSEGVRMLGVATVQEALELREAGITAPILVLFQPAEECFASAVEHNLRLTVSTVAAAERIGDLARRANKVAPIHCKFDTGMGRQGFSIETAVNDLRRITHISHIDIEGICTHFAVADVADDSFTALQLKRFKQLLRQVDKEGIPYEVVHAANSGAIVAHPAAAFDIVRPGIMAYGAWPMGARPELCPLRSVLRWETRVALVKHLPAEWSIGYGRTYITEKPTVTAVLPVGYRDGYQRALSNRAEVLIRGRRCPIRGRVSMDQIIVDVTDVPGIATGDTAVLIGTDGSETITVEELAERAGTIPNEILTGIGPRVERVYVE